jgi:hypothetical protein
MLWPIHRHRLTTLDIILRPGNISSGSGPLYQLLLNSFLINVVAVVEMSEMARRIHDGECMFSTDRLHQSMPSSHYPLLSTTAALSLNHLWSVLWTYDEVMTLPPDIDVENVSSSGTIPDYDVFNGILKCSNTYLMNLVLGPTHLSAISLLLVIASFHLEAKVDRDKLHLGCWQRSIHT